ncbi:MAG: HAD family hydrolase [Gemmobacter sp.]
MIDGIVFDKDGTLFDFRRTWAGWAARLLAELGDGEAARIRAMAAAIGFDLAAQEFAPDSPVIAGTAGEIAAILSLHRPDIALPALLDRMNALAAAADLVEAVPLRPFLMRLRGRGLRLGVATNDAEAPAHAHLAAAGVTDLFDFVAGYDSGHGSKPGPGPLLAFAAATGLDPARVAMVGDSLHDLHAGQAAGMIPVAVLTGVAGHAELAPHAAVVLPDIGGLEAWIAARAAA